MVEEQWKPHGKVGYTTCLPDKRWDDDEWAQNVGHALVGLVGIAMWDLRDADDKTLRRLAQEAADTIASKADGLMFQQKAATRAKAEATGVLTALAKGFAALALNTPETGVTRLGFHACYWEHSGCPKDRDR